MALKLFVEVMSKRSDTVEGVDAGAKLAIDAVGVNRVLQFNKVTRGFGRGVLGLKYGGFRF